jgi:hypothetical protein
MSSRTLRTPDGTYEFVRVLKADFFSINELYARDGRLHVLKRSRFRFLGGWLLYPLAIGMSWREYQVYRRVADLPGVPPLGPRAGWDGYFHEFIPGRTLKEIRRREPLPDNFFPRLEETLRLIHERRIYYLDLAKSDNVIVGDDGRPYLIDFQISICFPPARSFPGRMLGSLFRFFQAEDYYHYCKHKRRHRRDQLTREEWECSRRTPFGRFWRRWIWTPYLAVKRLIYPHGSNEIIWWKWRQPGRRCSELPAANRPGAPLDSD